ncbi:MAG TPA: Na+/H+ antiporter subunit E [Marinobacter sp.]|nr:Na+/H+ antiporter subunit E [Marinobacter sp.]
MRQHVRTTSLWFLLFYALWLLLTSAQGLIFGAASALAAASLASAIQLPLPVLNWRFVPGFLLFFFQQLLQGGWDVAKRALAPRINNSDGWVTFALTATHPRVQLMLSALVGLLPGTLASRIDQTQMHLHILDQQSDWQMVVSKLEWHLERLLGEDADA